LKLTADAFFKAAITLLPEVPRNIQIDGKVRGTEPFLVEYINNLASTLLVVPVSMLPVKKNSLLNSLYLYIFKHLLIKHLFYKQYRIINYFHDINNKSDIIQLSIDTLT